MRNLSVAHLTAAARAAHDAGWLRWELPEVVRAYGRSAGVELTDYDVTRIVRSVIA